MDWLKIIWNKIKKIGFIVLQFIGAIASIIFIFFLFFGQNFIKNENKKKEIVNKINKKKRKVKVKMEKIIKKTKKIKKENTEVLKQKTERDKKAGKYIKDI